MGLGLKNKENFAVQNNPRCLISFLGRLGNRIGHVSENKKETHLFKNLTASDALNVPQTLFLLFLRVEVEFFLNEHGLEKEPNGGSVSSYFLLMISFKMQETWSNR